MTSKFDQVPKHPEGMTRKFAHADGTPIARPHAIDLISPSANEVLSDHAKPGKVPPLAAPHPDTLTRPKFDKAGRDNARAHGSDPNNGPAVIAEGIATGNDFNGTFGPHDPNK